MKKFLDGFSAVSEKEMLEVSGGATTWYGESLEGLVSGGPSLGDLGIPDPYNPNDDPDLG